jgi:hypothetical protein
MTLEQFCGMTFPIEIGTIALDFRPARTEFAVWRPVRIHALTALSDAQELRLHLWVSQCMLHVQDKWLADARGWGRRPCEDFGR